MTASKHKKNMTPAAILANQQNALLSTGPNSPEGKDVSKLNAEYHGFRGTRILIEGENPEEYQKLVRSLIHTYHPQGSYECFLVSQLSARMWENERALCFKKQALERAEFRDELLKELVLLEGYHNRIERAITRLRKELTAVQTLRGKVFCGFNGETPLRYFQEEAFFQTEVYHGPCVPELPTQAESGLEGVVEMAMMKVMTERRKNRSGKDQLKKYTDTTLSHIDHWDEEEDQGNNPGPA